MAGIRELPALAYPKPNQTKPNDIIPSHPHPIPIPFMYSEPESLFIFLFINTRPCSPGERGGRPCGGANFQLGSQGHAWARVRLEIARIMELHLVFIFSFFLYLAIHARRALLTLRAERTGKGKTGEERIGESSLGRLHNIL